MQKQPQKNRSTVRRGFTLMEILIVLVILVAILSMVGPRVLASKAKADIQSAKVQIGLFQASLEQYALDMNGFPTTEMGLSALVKEPESEEKGETKGKESKSKWGGPYTKGTSLPKDPWGNEYKYEYPPTHNKGKDPELWSLGPDQKEDTDDDIVSWDKDAEDKEPGAPATGKSAAPKQASN